MLCYIAYLSPATHFLDRVRIDPGEQQTRTPTKYTIVHMCPSIRMDKYVGLLQATKRVLLSCCPPTIHSLFQHRSSQKRLEKSGDMPRRLQDEVPFYDAAVNMSYHARFLWDQLEELSWMVGPLGRELSGRICTECYRMAEHLTVMRRAQNQI